MDASAVPYKFAGPWAADATTGYVTDPVPATASGAAASQQLGFPPLTATSTGSGGTPPNIADFNGLEFYNTSWLQWLQAGGPIAYDPALSSNIGGYPQGAVLQSTVTFGQFWQSTADNNTSDPDTGGANWQRLPIGLSGVKPVAISSNTTLTLANWGQMIEVGNGVAITTPNAGAASFGMVISFYFNSGNTLTLGSGSFYGGGLAGSTISNPPLGSYLSIVCDGANWFVLSASPGILGTPPGIATSTVGQPIGANYNNTVGPASFIAPCAGTVVAYGGINLDLVASYAVVATLTISNGSSTASQADSTNLSQSHHCQLAVTKGQTVQVSITVTSGTNSPAVNATYHAGYIFVPGV